jgi:hypothetical protein
MNCDPSPAAYAEFSESLPADLPRSALLKRLLESQEWLVKHPPASVEILLSPVDMLGSYTPSSIPIPQSSRIDLQEAGKG